MITQKRLRFATTQRRRITQRCSRCFGLTTTQLPVNLVNTCLPYSTTTRSRKSWLRRAEMRSRNIAARRSRQRWHKLRHSMMQKSRLPVIVICLVSVHVFKRDMYTQEMIDVLTWCNFLYIKDALGPLLLHLLIC